MYVLRFVFYSRYYASTVGRQREAVYFYRGCPWSWRNENSREKTQLVWGGGDSAALKKITNTSFLSKHIFLEKYEYSYILSTPV